VVAAAVPVENTERLPDKNHGTKTPAIEIRHA